MGGAELPRDRAEELSATWLGCGEGRGAGRIRGGCGDREPFSDAKDCGFEAGPHLVYLQRVLLGAGQTCRAVRPGQESHLAERRTPLLGRVGVPVYTHTVHVAIAICHMELSPCVCECTRTCVSHV